MKFRNKSKDKAVSVVKNLGNSAKIEKPDTEIAKLREPIKDDPTAFPTMEDIDQLKKAVVNV